VTAQGIHDEVRALAELDLDGLRAEWRRRFGPPPRLRSPDLLRHMLAWRIQVAAFGGLDAETRRRLRQGPASSPLSPAPTPGTRITREWQGTSHAVEVAADGFVYNGQRFRSLSQVARTITGARWNGPRFFGLRAPEAMP
jgi:hypothetical protein